MVRRRVVFGLWASFASLVGAQLSGPGSVPSDGPTPTNTASSSSTSVNIFAAPTPGQIFVPTQDITAIWTIPEDERQGTFDGLFLQQTVPNPTRLSVAGQVNIDSNSGQGSAKFNIPALVANMPNDLVHSLEGTQWHLQLVWSIPQKFTSVTVEYDSGTFTLSSNPQTPTSTITRASSSSTAQVATSTAGIGGQVTVTTTPGPTATLVESSEVPGGLSTAAKAGIGAGVGVVALIALVALFFFFWRHKKNRSRAAPAGMAYSHANEVDSRDLHTEKEMNVVTGGGVYSPIERHTGFESPPPAQHVRDPYTSEQYHSQEPSPNEGMPPEQPRDWQGGDAQAAYENVPLAPVSLTAAHLQEPGMTAEEIARLDEEERRIDEAIAEAERRRKP